MKTQIIQLETHDDVTSTRDKIGWGQAGRVLLVWPERGRILNRRLDLILIKRHCTRMGKQLSLVCNDDTVRFYARSLAISVFDNPEQANRRTWRTTRTKAGHAAGKNKPGRPDLEAMRLDALHSPPPWLDSLVVRLVIFTLGVMGLLAIAALLLPQANVEISPKIQSQQTSLQVRASLSNSTVSLSGEIPAHIQKIIVEGSDTLSVNGTIQIPDKPSSGPVRFSNLTGEAVSIPAGTIVRTSAATPLRFSTLQPATLNAGIGQAVTVTVQAITPGSGGNISVGQINTIEGDLGLNATVSNTGIFQGGSDRIISVVSAADQQALYQKLSEQLIKTASLELSKKLITGDQVLQKQPYHVEALDETYTPARGEPSDRLGLKLRLQVEYLVATAADLDYLANKVLDASLPAGYEPIEKSTKFNNQTDPEIDTHNLVQWRLQVIRQVRARVDIAQTINLVLGQPPQQAEERLSHNLLLESKPVIRLYPSWWPRLPILPFRIEIKIVEA